MIYPIVLYGDPVLKKPADDIDKEKVDVKELAQDMFETMYQASGVGLAAPQIGKSLRMFVVDSTPMMDNPEEGTRKAFINPEILEEEGEEWAFEEGCLSIPNIREDVFRLSKIKMRYFDEDWNEHEEIFDDIVARIIQHEYDHIEGILFTDHLTAFKKRLLKTRLTNISKGKVDVDYRVKAPAKK
jgi:peptide deformylase